MNNKEKILQIGNLLMEVSDPLVEKFFDTNSEKFLDDKIEVLTALSKGKTPSEIPKYYKVLELYPKDDNVWWD